VLEGGPIEEFTPVALREQQLDFMAQFGICPRQKRRPLVGSRFTRSMVELFNVPEPLRGSWADYDTDATDSARATARPWPSPSRA
jgi:hypothetical protein